MYWKDEGYLLSKNNFDENSIIIETFTSDHGKYPDLFSFFDFQSSKILFPT